MQTHALTHPHLSPKKTHSKNSKVKYFVLALVSAKGERIAPETYRALPVQYRIAALEEKKGPGSRSGTVTVEVRGCIYKYGGGGQSDWLMGRLAFKKHGD